MSNYYFSYSCSDGHNMDQPDSHIDRMVSVCRRLFEQLCTGLLFQPEPTTTHLIKHCPILSRTYPRSVRMPPAQRHYSQWIISVILTRLKRPECRCSPVCVLLGGSDTADLREGRDETSQPVLTNRGSEWSSSRLNCAVLRLKYKITTAIIP